MCLSPPIVADTGADCPPVSLGLNVGAGPDRGDLLRNREKSEIAPEMPGHGNTKSPDMDHHINGVG